MPPLTLGRLLAVLVLILAVVLAAIGKLPLVEAGFFAALALADLVP